MKMKNAIAIGFGVIMMASVAAATTVCNDDSGWNVVTQVNPTGGCTVSSFTFSNFAVGLAGGTGSPFVTIAGVADPGSFGTGVDFNPNLGGNGITDIHFVFELTSSSGPISSAYLFNGGTGTGTIGERICDHAGVSIFGQCTGAELANMTAINGQSASVTFSGDTPIWIWKDISINSSTLDHNSSVLQEFNAVPEPASLSLMGLGLLGLGFVSRKIRK